MNILKYHAKQMELNSQELSHLTGMNYHKVCRLLRQSEEHIETQITSAIELILLFETLGLKDKIEDIREDLKY